MKSVAEITRNMAHSIGTSKYIKHFTGAFVFTDGIEQLREDTDCYWLVDAIASYRRKEPFQVWELEVFKDKTAVLTMKEDTNTPLLVEQKIHYTDFPLENIKFYVNEGGYGTEENWTNCLVLMLPSEY